MAKILMVEDDLSLAQMNFTGLTNAGFEVEIVHDGDSAAEAILKGGYDLILLDLMLPGKDGLTVLSELKDKPTQKPNGPIVAMSNLSEHVAVKKSLELGAKYFINKIDLTPKQLAGNIKEWINL